MIRIHFQPLSLCIALLCLLFTGCEPVSHLSWSPDGAKAAYFARVDGKMLPGIGVLMDPAGKITDQLGPTFGSFAWSVDSKSLYFGGYDNKGSDTDESIHKWLIDAEDQAAPAPDGAQKEFPSMVLNRWQNGAVERLVPLGNCYVLFVHVSSDQSWIAVVALVKGAEKDDGHARLFAYNTASKKLYTVSDRCGNGACFTGTNKLVYVEADREGGVISNTGQIVEVKLDESAEHLQRTPLVNVLWRKTGDLKPVDDGLLFTSEGQTFPAKSIPATVDKDIPVSLFHFTRANGGITTAADSTGPLFLPSPDGKRILFIKISPAKGDLPEKREIDLTLCNGSGTRSLCDISAYGDNIPLWPSWHGNDLITFISPAGTDIPAKPDQPARLAFDIVDYKIPTEGQLEPVKTISQGWPVEMKPWMKSSDYLTPQTTHAH